MASQAVGSEVVQDFVRQPSDTKRRELMICFDAPGEVGQNLSSSACDYLHQVHSMGRAVMGVGMLVYA